MIYIYNYMLIISRRYEDIVRVGPSTIVACPGRLNDFLEGGQVRIDGVLKLILDEVPNRFQI